MSKKKVLSITSKVDAIAWVKENGYPAVGTFTEDKWLKKFYKQLPMESLIEWAIQEGVTYKECPDSEPIYRMRVCMAILYRHFPKAPTAPKSKSKYADYTTEQLIQMSIDHELVLDVCENMSIMRMRAIMALRNIKAID